MLSIQDILILSLKSDINELLKQPTLTNYDYGFLRGCSRTLFTLGHMSEDEYKKVFSTAQSKWIS